MNTIKKFNWKRFSYIGLAVLVVFALLFSGLQLSLEKSANNQVKVVLTVGNPIDAFSGTPDYVGTSSVVVQQAVDALPAAGGEVNLISPAYTFTGTVSRAINNVKISGVNGTTITYAGACFSVGAQTGWVFEDIKIAVGGSITNFANSELRNVTIGATYYTLRAPNTTGNIAAPAITDSGLTSGQVVYAGTGGLLSNEAGFEYNAGTNTFTAGQITDSGLTAGRVPYAGAAGLLSDEATFEYNSGTNTLSVDAIDAPTGRGATYVIAASDATALEKSQADVVCDGSTDATPIMAAITANLKNIYLTSGTFVINTYIEPNNGLHLEGSGPSTILQLKGGVNNANVLHISSKNSIEISNMIIDGNRAAVTDLGGDQNVQNCAFVNNSYNINFHDMVFKNSLRNGIRWISNAPTNVNLRNCTVSGCSFFYNLNAGEHLDISAEYIRHVNNHYNQNTYAVMYKSGNGIFDSCYFVSNTHGPYGESGTNSGRFSFINCTSNHNTNKGYYFIGRENDEIIGGYAVANTGVGIQLDSCKSCIITGVTVRDNAAPQIVNDGNNLIRLNSFLLSGEIRTYSSSLSSGTVGNSVVSWQNPEAQAMMVTGRTRITVGATAASVGDWGLATTVQVVENCEDVWNVTAPAVGHSTCAIDTTYVERGTNDIAITATAGITNADILAWEQTAATLDLSTATHITLKFRSNVALNAGDMSIALDQAADFGTPIAWVTLPAIAANRTTLIVLNPNGGAALGAGYNSIDSIGIRVNDVTRYVSGKIIYLDDIRAVTVGTDLVNDANLQTLGQAAYATTAPINVDYKNNDDATHHDTVIMVSAANDSTGLTGSYYINGQGE